MRNPVGLKFYIQLEATIVHGGEFGRFPTIAEYGEPSQEDRSPEFARSC